MKGLLLTLAMGAALAGCASTQKVLDGPVTETFNSTKSVNEVVFCLANRNNVPVLEKDDGSKVILLKNGYGGVSMAFTVFPNGTGSRIEWRKKFGTIGGAWKRCVGIQPDKE